MNKEGLKMSEYKKMISGQIYDPNDFQLVKMRMVTRELLTRINASLQDIKDGDRLKLCVELFGKVGKKFWLQPPFYCDYGKNIKIGKACPPKNWAS